MCPVVCDNATAQKRGPQLGCPLPSLKGSDVWALGLYRVFKGYMKDPLLRAHAKGKVQFSQGLGSNLGFRV